MLLVASAAGNAEWGPRGNTWVFLAVLALIGIACVLINNFYNKHYGTLPASAGQQARAAAAVVLGILGILGILGVVGVRPFCAAGCAGPWASRSMRPR